MKSYIILITILIITTKVFAGGSLFIESNLDINNSTSETWIYRITPPAGYIYTPSTWKLYLPIKAENIFYFPSDSVTYRANRIEDLNSLGLKELSFDLPDIDDSVIITFSFDVNEVVKKIGDHWVYEHLILKDPGFEYEKEPVELTFHAQLPKEFLFVSSVPEKTKLSNYVQGQAVVFNLNDFSGSSPETIKILFDKIEETQEEETTQNQEGFNYFALQTEEFSEYYRGILLEADKLVPILEEKLGKKSPYSKFSVALAEPENPIFIENTIAAYFGEGILKWKNETKFSPQREILQYLLHEVIHGFNEPDYKEYSATWWDEGLAEYISMTLLTENGYDFTPDFNLIEKDIKDCKYGILRTPIEKTDGLIESIEWPTNEPEEKYNETDFRFNYINEWIPNIENGQKVICHSGIQADLGPLMYEYSTSIVKSIEDKFGKGIFLALEKVKSETGLKFSSDHKKLNNQVNFLLSQVTKQNTTEFFKDFLLEVEDWKEAKTKIENVEEEISQAASQSDEVFFQQEIQLFEEAKISLLNGDFNLAIETADKLSPLLQETEKNRKSVERGIQNYKKTLETYTKQNGKEIHNKEIMLLTEAETQYSLGNLSAASAKLLQAKEQLKITQEEIKIKEEKIPMQNENNFATVYIIAFILLTVSLGVVVYKHVKNSKHFPSS